MSNIKVVNPAHSAIGGQAVTGTVTFTDLTRAIYVGTAGNIPVTFGDGTTVTINDAANGYHPLQLQAIGGSSSGLTASGIVALF